MKTKVILSKRRTISIEITTEQSIIIRAPFGTPDKKIENILQQKQTWITNNILKIQQRNLLPDLPKFTDQELMNFKTTAMNDITNRVEFFSSIIGVTYFKISFGLQKTRWGSCSSKGNLRFNCLLMCAPPEIRDYVVVHELCHRKYMNHSSDFWNEVQTAFPIFKDARQWLKENGSQLISRLP